VSSGSEGSHEKHTTGTHSLTTAWCKHTAHLQLTLAYQFMKNNFLKLSNDEDEINTQLHLVLYEKLILLF
jgi:hypothetical protein